MTAVYKITHKQVVGIRAFASNFEEAARDSSRYKRRADKSIRAFGGYNLLFFGDTQQIPPIPASAALFLPPLQKKSRGCPWTNSEMEA